jgi:hypothetical protein
VGDKRKLERFLLRVPARISFRAREDSEAILDAKTRDISAEGAYLFMTNYHPPVGANVEVELTLTIEKLRELLDANDHVLVKVHGRILRQEANGVVVVFNHPFRFFPGPGKSVPREPNLMPA